MVNFANGSAASNGPVLEGEQRLRDAGRLLAIGSIRAVVEKHEEDCSDHQPDAEPGVISYNNH